MLLSCLCVRIVEVNISQCDSFLRQTERTSTRQHSPLPSLRIQGFFLICLPITQLIQYITFRTNYSLFSLFRRHPTSSSSPHCPAHLPSLFIPYGEIFFFFFLTFFARDLFPFSLFIFTPSLRSLYLFAQDFHCFKNVSQRIAEPLLFFQVSHAPDVPQKYIVTKISLKKNW